MNTLIIGIIISLVGAQTTSTGLPKSTLYPTPSNSYVMDSNIAGLIIGGGVSLLILICVFGPLALAKEPLPLIAINDPESQIDQSNTFKQVTAPPPAYDSIFNSA